MSLAFKYEQIKSFPRTFLPVYYTSKRKPQYICSALGKRCCLKNMLWQIFHHSMDVFSVFSPYHSLTVRSAVNSKLRSQG